MNYKSIIEIMSHLRVLEVPSLLIWLSILYMQLGEQNLFAGIIVYALIRLFINIRFKIQQEKFQRAMLEYLETLEESEDDGI
tara:strand:+ start:2058 stop:2303 length:246 start_codon:yes stop_codon:yes gene_type:complete